MLPAAASLALLANRALTHNRRKRLSSYAIMDCLSWADMPGKSGW